MKRNCMTQKELADRWTISHRTLERWRWAGEGSAYMKLGGRVVYRVSDIEAFEQEVITPRLTSGSQRPDAIPDLPNARHAPTL